MCNKRSNRTLEKLKDQIIVNVEHKYGKWQLIFGINIILHVVPVICLILLLAYVFMNLKSDSVLDTRIISLGSIVFGTILFTFLSKIYKLTTELNRKNEEYINIKNKILLAKNTKKLQEILEKYNINYCREYLNDER